MYGKDGLKYGVWKVKMWGATYTLLFMTTFSILYMFLVNYEVYKVIIRAFDINTFIFNSFQFKCDILQVKNVPITP